MSGREWTWVFAVALFALAGLVLAGISVFETQAVPAALPVAVALLSMALAITAFGIWSKGTYLASRIAILSRSIDASSATAADNRDRLDLFARELADFRQHAREPQPSVVEEMKSIRESFRDLSKRYERDAANAARRVAAPPPQPTMPPRERISLLLEPVIDLTNNFTAHYRARIGMTNELGSELPHATVLSNADRGGLRPSLDLHMAKLALPVIRRLRERHDQMRIFLPLGAATLADGLAIERLAGLIDEWRDVASAVTLEIQHQSLGTLTPPAIEGLARLAQRGVQMGLSGVSIVGLDLPALRKLGVRFLAVDAKSIDAGYGPGPAWQEFAQFGRAMQFQLVVTDIANRTQAASAARIARFASGEYFAPPRRVKAEASDMPVQDRAAA
ncbi:MAG: EAL domain-containing protein [Rhizobiales bacterium]|nr:EAL domain-containing protein [Hyphomicrobiales bacterium]